MAVTHLCKCNHGKRYHCKRVSFGEITYYECLHEDCKCIRYEFSKFEVPGGSSFNTGKIRPVTNNGRELKISELGPTGRPMY